MGYSCTQDAWYMLGVIGHHFATDGNPNVLTIDGKQYFFERGREQGDGAITGALYECLPDDMARKVGQVRIEPNGEAFTFPRVSRVDRQEIVSTFQDMRARNPQLLCAWAMGRI